MKAFLHPNRIRHLYPVRFYTTKKADMDPGPKGPQSLLGTFYYGSPKSTSRRRGPG